MHFYREDAKDAKNSNQEKIFSFISWFSSRSSRLRGEDVFVSFFETAKDGNAVAVVCGRDNLGGREIGRSSFHRNRSSPSSPGWPAGFLTI